MKAELKCDGERDCTDLSDEKDCPPRYPNGKYCSEDKYECKNHICVNRNDLCDGKDDCGDESDEAEEVCKNFTCDKAQKFQCNNFKCIPRYYVCNGEDDCGDGSDENNMTLCANRPRPCPNLFSDYKCANGMCVDRSKICNLHDDCGDQSDEKGCHEVGRCEDEIEGTRGGCQHRCNNLPNGSGYLCLCDRGYVVDARDPKKCIDVDECLSFGHNCTQTCTNMNGTYACSCIDGFALTDQFSGVCRSNEGTETKILFSTGEEIHGEVLAKQMKIFDVIKNETRIEAIDFDPKEMMLYWVDSEEKSIRRSFIPGTKEHPEAQIGYPQEIQSTTNKVTVIAYDYLTGNVYWAEVDRWTGISSPPRGVISASKNDGRYKREIVSGQLDNPTSIALDPEHGLMFWTDAGDKPKIESAWMDGTKRKTIVATGIGHPEALAIDFAMGHTLYWVDSKLNTLETMDHEGHKRHVLLRGGILRRPISVDVFENHIYWVNRDTGAVMQHDKFGRGVPVTIARNLANPRAVRVLHPQKYNLTAKDPCSQENFHCSHLCLLIPGGRARCACPNGQNFVDPPQTICQAGE